MSSKFSECAGMEVEIDSEQDQLGECIGEGAEGAVYELNRFNDIVAKVFKKDKRGHKQDKIETMVEKSMVSPEDQTEIPWTAWPIDPVFRPSDGSFLGYVMPYLNTDQHIDAQRYASQNLRWENSSQRQRYKPAINLVLTVYWLHQNGYAVGDLSEQNVRVNDGNVTLIDCDSYSIEGSDFAGQMEAPRYTPPEGRGNTHEGIKQTDQFGIAVHIFQFLMAGFHPYQAVGEHAVEGSLPQAIQQGNFPYGGPQSRNLSPPPRAPDFRRLPKSVRGGFEQCFSKGQNDPKARPSLEEWLAILSKEGGFDVDGIDTSDITFEDEGGKKRDRDWQEEIRQNPDNRRSGSTANTTINQTTTTTSSVGDSHWADELRDDQTAQSSVGTDKQSASKASAGKQSSNQSAHTSSFHRFVTIMVLMIIIWFLILLILL
jgi:hypothetical protein